jgi:hypothetical protein
MCLLVTLLVVGPRAGVVLVWLGWPERWDLTYQTPIVPILGFLFLPWTTLLHFVVAPGGVHGFDYVVVSMGLLVDLASLVGSGYSSRSGASMRSSATW